MTYIERLQHTPLDTENLHLLLPLMFAIVTSLAFLTFLDQLCTQQNLGRVDVSMQWEGAHNVVLHRVPYRMLDNGQYVCTFNTANHPDTINLAEAIKWFYSESIRVFLRETTEEQLEAIRKAALEVIKKADTLSDLIDGELNIYESIRGINASMFSIVVPDPNSGQYECEYILQAVKDFGLSINELVILLTVL